MKSAESPLGQLRSFYDEELKSLTDGIYMEIMDRYMGDKYMGDEYYEDESDYDTENSNRMSRDIYGVTEEEMIEEARSLKVNAMQEAAEKLMGEMYCETLVAAFSKKYPDWDFSVKYNDKYIPEFTASKKNTKPLTKAQIKTNNINQKIQEIISSMIIKSAHDTNSFFEKMRDSILKYRSKKIRDKYNVILNSDDLEYIHKMFMDIYKKRKIKLEKSRIKEQEKNTSSDKIPLKDINTIKVSSDQMKTDESIYQTSFIRFKNLNKVISGPSIGALLSKHYFYEVFDRPTIEAFGLLDDGEWDKMLTDIENHKRKEDNLYKVFKRNYVDDKGNHPFRDTKMIQVSTQLRFDSNGNATDITGETAPIIQDLVSTAVQKEKQSAYNSKISGMPSQAISDLVFPTNRSGHLPYFVQNTDGTLRVKRDKECLDMFYAMMESYHGNIEKWKKDQKEKEKQLQTGIDSKVLNELDMIKKGYYQGVENHKLVFRLPQNEEELQWVRNSQRFIKNFTNDTKSDMSILDKLLYKAMVNSKDGEFNTVDVDAFIKSIEGKGKDLYQAEKYAQEIAIRLFKTKCDYIKRKTGIDLSNAMPKLDFSEITNKIETDAYDEILNNLKRNSNSRKTITPRSSMIVKGSDNIFLTDAIFSVKEREFLRRTKIPLWSYKLGLPKNSAVIRKSSLKPLVIPLEILENEVARNTYGDTMAAMFFQLLVSNTPVDEVYFYKEIRTYEVAGKTMLSEKIKSNPYDDNASDIWVEKSPYKIAKEMWNKKTTVTKEYWRKHEPDEDSVRDCWEFKYKGVIFRPTDPEFKENSYDLFLNKADYVAIILISKIFRQRTEKSKTKSINFTYTNTNKRWEQLEYGGYAKDTTPGAPWRGLSKYGFKHGLENHFTYQAPFGYLRLIEAQWNAIQEDEITIDMIQKVVNLQGFNVTEVAEEYINKLRAEQDSTIGTREYDYDNFILVEEIKK